MHAPRMRGRSLPLDVDDALARFAVAVAPLRGAPRSATSPIGDLPPTPAAPDAPVAKDLATELTLLTVARRLGQPVGYVPEHGGDIVQNIVPTRRDADRQTSTSSTVELMFHTETAFHPHRPRYLLLLCLRGDPAASTTLASRARPVRRAARRRRVDGCSSRASAPRSTRASSTAAPTSSARRCRCVTGHRRRADVRVRRRPDGRHRPGGASRPSTACATPIDGARPRVVLEPGDLLVIDNNVAVHGRSPFTARFDGTRPLAATHLRRRRPRPERRRTPRAGDHHRVRRRRSIRTGPSGALTCGPCRQMLDERADLEHPVRRQREEPAAFARAPVEPDVQCSRHSGSCRVCRSR